MSNRAAVFFLLFCFGAAFAPRPLNAQNADSQRSAATSVAMLNYLATETRLVNTTKNNRLMLEDVYNKLVNNTNPGIVDETTQDFLMILLDDIERFRITSLQRERLQYILENQRAQAITEAMPNPFYLLGLAGPGGITTRMNSSSQSMNLSGSLSGNLSGLVGTAAGSISGNIAGSIAKTVANSVTKTVMSPMKLLVPASLMVLDSVMKYQNAVNTAGLDFVKDNWELDDKESAALHNLRSQTFYYMIDVARRNNLGASDTLNEESIDHFVNYCLDENLERRRQSLETNRRLYEKYAPYYLELAKVYYELEMYQECIGAAARYEAVKAPIFRKDYDYAAVLPKVIISGAYMYDLTEAYADFAGKYLDDLVANTTPANWESRYFAAQTYINLAAIENSRSNLERAYTVLLDNVTFLSKQQEERITAYLKPVDETIQNNLSKEQKQQREKVIKELKEARKTETPPLLEPLLVNYRALLMVMDELDTPEQERGRVNAMLDKAFIIPALRHAFFGEAYSYEDDNFVLTYKKTFFGKSFFERLIGPKRVSLKSQIKNIPLIFRIALIALAAVAVFLIAMMIICIGMGSARIGIGCFVLIAVAGIAAGFTFDHYNIALIALAAVAGLLIVMMIKLSVMGGAEFGIGCFVLIVVVGIAAVFTFDYYNKSNYVKGINMEIPAAYLSENSRIGVTIRGTEETAIPELAYTVGEVKRGKSAGIEKFRASLAATIAEPFLIERNRAYTLYAVIATNDVSQTLVFECPEGTTKFRFAGVE
jgi:hypothetical protein